MITMFSSAARQPVLFGTRPQPSLLDLRHGFAAVRQADDAFVDKLCAPWRRPGDQAFWQSRSAWNIAAIVDAWSATRGALPAVWVPEFFCEPTLSPLRQRSLKLRFYPIDASGQPDWDQIDANPNALDIFLLVHFFGHASDAVRARSLCDVRGALLIEDAAHAMRPAPGIGELGDFVCYSPWKFFSIPNGAVLVRRPDCRLAREPLVAAMQALGQKPSAGMAWLRTTMKDTLVRWQGRGPKAFPPGDFFTDPNVATMPQRPRAAPYAGPLLMARDVAEAANRRRANDAAIRRHFETLSGWQPFAAPADAPWRTVFRADRPERAARAHDVLRAAGIEAECWPPLPPEARQSSYEAVRLRNSLLCLPCHQGLNPRQISQSLQRQGL